MDEVSRLEFSLLAMDLRDITSRTTVRIRNRSDIRSQSDMPWIFTSNDSGKPLVCKVMKGRRHNTKDFALYVDLNKLKFTQ